jgi:hypothetical protein
MPRRLYLLLPSYHLRVCSELDSATAREYRDLPIASAALKRLEPVRTRFRGKYSGGS